MENDAGGSGSKGGAVAAKVPTKKRRVRRKRLDPHIGCYSYPCCDEAPLGCSLVSGDDAEPYGYRD